MSKPALPINALTLAIVTGLGSTLGVYLWANEPLVWAIGIGFCSAVLSYCLYPFLWASKDR